MAETLVQAALDDAHARKEYRPVAVGIVRDMEGRIFFVCSAKNTDNWGFPQGGIEENESAAQALFRELEEEVGVGRAHFLFEEYLGHDDLDAEDGRKDKRGFTKGKRYFFFSLRVTDRPAFDLYLMPNTEEVSACLWVEPNEVPKVLSTTRSEKRELIVRWLSKIF